MPLTLFNFLGTFLVGGTVALLLYAAIKTFKLRAPAWLYPVAIGGAMIAFQIYNDYTWFGRTADRLPSTHVVTGSFTSTSPLKLWTYLVAPVDRFSVLDRGSIQRNPKVPDLVIADVLLVTRFRQTARSTQIFDCAGDRRADALPGMSFDETGRPQDAQWVALDGNDPMLAAACG